MNASLDKIVQGLRRAFPAVQPLSPLGLLGEGFGSWVVETPGGVVFRVAKVAEAGEAYAREVRLLPVLQTHLPVAIPQPRWYLPRTDAFPYGVIGYPRLPGSPPDPAFLRKLAVSGPADAIGEILHTLHTVPLQGELADLLPGAPSFRDRRAGWQALWDQTREALRQALAKGEYHRVEDWWQGFLSDNRMAAFPAVLTHGDFWFENLLVEGGRVVGLLDFQEAGVDDPVRDFVPQLYLGERWMRRVLEHYQKVGGTVDEGFEHRLRNLWALREFGGVDYALRYNDREEFNDSIEKIRKGPILSPYGLDGWRSG